MTKPVPRVTQVGVKVSPADRLVSSLTGVYFKTSETAEILGVSQQTLRRLMRDETKKLSAPSMMVEQGGMVIYLYTPKDIEELQAYFNGQKPTRRKTQKKRSKT